MNILFLVGKYPGFGGVETVTTILSNGFIKRGHKVFIASFEAPNEEAKKGKLSSSVELVKLDYPVKKKENIQKLKSLVEKKSIDFVINQWAVPYFVAQFLNKIKKGSKAKVIAVHHNQPDTNARLHEIDFISENSGIFKKCFLKLKHSAYLFGSRLSLRYVYEKADCFVVLSPSFVPLLSKFIGVKSPTKVKVIGNPLTIGEAPMIEKENEIIMVGRIEFNQKRNLRALEIWDRIHVYFPDWKMIFVGDGPDSDKLSAEIDKRKLPRVEITGFVDPLPYYQRARILLLTSEYEGFGLVLLEAMKNGVVPVALNSYAALNDIVPSNDYGVILPYPFDADIASEQLRNLMLDAEILKVRSMNAKKIPALFSEDKILEDWEQLFNEMQG